MPTMQIYSSQGKGSRNTNEIIKKDILIINMNMTSRSETLGFSCYPHKDTCDIFSEFLVLQILKAS